MMEKVYIFRGKSTEQGTFGYITHDGNFWYSLELPYKNNIKNLSSINTGEYTCRIFFSNRFKRYLFMLRDVEGRTYILIHSANFAGDIEKGWQSHLNGCIAIGKKIGSFPNKYGNTQKAVLNSRLALREFMDNIENEDFKLIIEEL